MLGQPSWLRSLLTAVLALYLVGCGGSSDASGLSVEDSREGLLKTESGWLLRTGQITLAPGEERFACYALTLGEDLAITEFNSPKVPFVHHFLLVSATKPEPEGFSDCNTLFRPTWLPMYVATTAASRVTLPDGSAKLLKAGTQIVVQAHLLNGSPRQARGAIEIGMGVSPLEHPEPVGITVFGSGNINVPAQGRISVTNTCRLQNDVRLYTVLPHMHRQGRQLELQVGRDEQSLQPVYERAPFDFDDQHFDPFARTLPRGSLVRTRCAYENTTDHPVRFGESAEDEMCFLFGFRVGGSEIDTCTATFPLDRPLVPPDPGAGVCSEVQRTSELGRPCTAGGHECRADLFCSADMLNTKDGTCFKIGCFADGDCGGGTCCTLPLVGTMANICVPEACRPSYCIPTSLPPPDLSGGTDALP